MGDSHLQVAYARGNNKHLSTLDVPRTSSLVPRTSPLALPINNPQSASDHITVKKYICPEPHRQQFLSSQRIQFERCVHRIMVLIVLGTYRIFHRSSAAICSSGSWKWQHAESIRYGSWIFKLPSRMPFVNRKEQELKQTGAVDHTIQVFNWIKNQNNYWAQGRIPLKFVGQFGDELSSIAKLAVPDGRVWQVGLTKFGRKIWFDQGWQNFVESQSISAGYFLLFKYEKNSIFRVLIFDMTACEIDYPYEDDMACEMCVEISEEQFKHEAELLSRKRKMEDGLERDEPNAEPDLLVSLRKSGIYITEKYKELYSTEELERAVYIARAFKATNPKPNPLFMIIWKANDKPCREVYAPARFAYQYVDEDSKSVEVQAPSGRKWSLGIHWRATGGFFLAKGWAGVSDYVHLTEGDICIFELVRHRDVVFKLHVFHQ
ncbi:B3 domain-containing transcription factor VRN1 [Citrus sinensis]|uniref:B3 domain-containing transcription factor VRN1 n=1 Tax=Citrus sinensis TaxID=2711 RepID=A0ACB8IJC8_CITSI|nr:B3 domain-containing transcription factor VRN1 [Citrus sinensis]